MIFIREPDGSLRPRTRAEAKVSGAAARAAKAKERAEKIAAKTEIKPPATMLFIRAADGSVRAPTDAERRSHKRKSDLTIEQLREVQRDTLPRIYIIRHGLNGRLFKIGRCTGSALNRLADMQVGNPIELFLVREWVVEHAPTSVMEHKIHKKLGHLKIRGEWFRSTMPDIVRVVDHALRREAHEANYANIGALEVEKNDGTVRVETFCSQGLLSDFNKMPG